MNKNVIEKMYSSTGNVELAEVKVDLAVVDDINKSYADSKKELGIAANATKLAYAAIDEVMAAYRQNGIKSNETIQMIKTLKDSVKSLGIDLPANIVSIEKEVSDNLKNSQSMMSKLQNAKKSF
jgi:hypothetical protein